MPIDEVFPELKESEDESIRKEIIDWMEGGNTYDWHDNKMRWIAYLERQKEQNPANATQTDANKNANAEWSEKDEEMLGAMIDIVSNSLYEPLCPREGMLDWLKSLRPRLHWKPSEKQMQALESVYFDCDSRETSAVLSSLMSDLQKL